jgi:hypothetical protein
LAARGYRVVVPYARGCGTTAFLSDATLRNGEPCAIAVDLIDLMDALEIEKAILAAVWPQRCKALVCVSGYLLSNPASNALPLPAAE